MNKEDAQLDRLLTRTRCGIADDPVAPAGLICVHGRDCGAHMHPPTCFLNIVFRKEDLSCCGWGFEMRDDAWQQFISLLDHDTEIQRVVFSTNAIEPLNARYRRAVKARGHVPQ